MSNSPLYEQIRPTNLNEIIGQEHLLQEGGFLTTLVNNKKLISLILWGPPGVGKTTIAKILAKECNYTFVAISAMFAGIQEIKSILDKAKADSDAGIITTLFVDEIHRLNTKQQDVFLPVLEDGTIILLGATTENPSFHLNKALLSRCQVVELYSLERQHFLLLLQRVEHFYGISLNLSDEVIDYLVSASNGDGRYFISILETIKLKSGNGISVDDIKAFIRKRVSIYDKNKEEHYNLISALHKSIRGSDEQASIYWFSRMVVGGEDINYIARRLLRIASEDIGLADPNAVAIVVAAWDAFERLGSPEGELMIAEAVIYLALAPKSNSVYTATKKAMSLAKVSSNVMPPKHILNAPTSLMQKLEYGKGYQYDHDSKNGFSAQNYFPEKMKREEFYIPKNFGFEKELQKRIAYLNYLRSKKSL